MRSEIRLAFLIIIILQCIGAVQGQCPDGWTGTPTHNMCIQFKNTARTFEQAESDCMGLCPECHLVSIPTMFDNGKVAEYGRFMWIGLHDPFSNGSWVWTDGNKWPNYNWCPGSPTNLTGNNCTAMFSTHSGCWDNTFCGDMLTSVCGRFMINDTSIPIIEIETYNTFSLPYFVEPIVQCVRPWVTEWMCTGCQLVTVSEGASNDKFLFGIRNKELILLANITVASSFCVYDQIIVGRTFYFPFCSAALCYSYFLSNSITPLGHDCNAGWNFVYENGDPIMHNCLSHTPNTPTMNYWRAEGSRGTPTTGWQWISVESRSMTGLADYQYQFGRFWSVADGVRLTWFAMMDPSNSTLVLSDFDQTRRYNIPSTVWDNRGIITARMFSTDDNGISTVKLALVSARAVHIIHTTDFTDRYQTQAINLAHDINTYGVYFANETTLHVSAQNGTEVYAFVYRVTW